jgi:hypothetical protein
MALDNYANLRQAVKKWTARDDSDEILADCITEAEQEIFYGQSPLRTHEMLVTTTVATALKVIPYPDRLLQIVSIEILIDGRYFKLKALPENISPSDSETGTPSYYTMRSGIELDITPDKSYTFKIVHYARPLPLSDDSPTNPILTKYPLAYKFGVVASVYMFAREEELANVYALRMRDVIAKANAASASLMMGDLPTQIIHGDIP